MALPRTLVEQHWMSGRLALAVLDRIEEMREPIGRLALRTGALGLGPCLHILDEQIEERSAGRDRRFGEIGIALGYLTREQVDELVRLQRAETPTFDALVSDPDLERAYCERDEMDALGHVLRSGVRRAAGAGSMRPPLQPSGS